VQNLVTDVMEQDMSVYCSVMVCQILLWSIREGPADHIYIYIVIISTNNN